MVKKLFALASVTALAGLVSAVGVAGCSDTVDNVTPTPDASPDVKVKPDAAAADDDDDDVEPSCMSTDPIDATTFPYAKALNAPGSCTAAEATKLAAYYKEAYDANAADKVLASEWGAEVSEDCAKCVFTASDADTWGAMLVKDDKLEAVNRGGCIEIQSGKEECGKAYQQVSDCRLEACITKCKTQDEFSACLQDGQAIFTGPCKESYDAMDTACGTSLQAYETACQGKAWTFEGPIKVQCVGTAKTDAGDGG